MKQFTSKDQTAKLIELGFEKPRVAMPKFEWKDGEPQFHYTIGELLSFLPKSIKVNDLFFTLCIHSSSDYWIVEYADIAFGAQARLHKEELIDALFTEIVILKEEGVI
ncbi:MAG: hypothetical protein J6U69_02330 [Alistipes sp.]|nr:hypothetical protein [Alistipes sp.]